MTKQSPLKVAVLENGIEIGLIEANDFMKEMEVDFGMNKFLRDYVSMFNTSRSEAGDPTRVKTKLVS